MSERVNIEQPVAVICRSFDLNPEDVSRLEITPGELKATVFRLNNDGKKYIGGDGFVATETFEFRVKA